LSEEPQGWVALARILRARGNKGEVAVELLTDFPQRLKDVREVFLRGGSPGGPANAEPRRVAVKNFWIDQNHRGMAVYHFEGSASISEAEKYRGMEVLIPFAQRVVLPAKTYFVQDLMGCSVFETSAEAPVVSSSPCSLASAPALIGAVRDVLGVGEDVAGTPLLVVGTRNGELLIPLAEDICTRIDTAARRIDVILPEGLRNLNGAG
jgi:16S rRNA processing protein RimM